MRRFILDVLLSALASAADRRFPELRLVTFGRYALDGDTKNPKGVYKLNWNRFV